VQILEGFILPFASILNEHSATLADVTA